MIQLLSVGAGGFIGAVMRYGLTKLFPASITFPFATLIANLIAGFLAGFFTGLFLANKNSSPNLKLFLTTGMMGGLSTFSTFSTETVNLFYGGKFAFAVLNIGVNLICGIGGAFLGMYIAQLTSAKA